MRTGQPPIGELEDDPSDPQAGGDSSHQQGLAGNAEDFRRIARSMARVRSKIRGTSRTSNLMFPGRLSLPQNQRQTRVARKAPMTETTVISIDLLGKSVMTDKEPFDDLDKQPAAADEGSQDLDDPLLPEIIEERMERGLPFHAILKLRSVPTRTSPAP